MRDNIAAAHVAGDQRAEANAHVAYTVNQKRIDKIMTPPQGQGLGSKFLDVLKTSRFGLGGGGGIQPLVGKTLGLVTEALGPELTAVAGPVGLLAGAAAAAVSGLKQLADSASGVAFNKNSSALGGSGAVPGAISGLAGVNGVSQAVAYNNAITSSSMGKWAGLNENQQNISGLWGKIDIGTQYWDAMEVRRHMPREGRAVDSYTSTVDQHGRHGDDLDSQRRRLYYLHACPRPDLRLLLPRSGRRSGWSVTGVVEPHGWGQFCVDSQRGRQHHLDASLRPDLRWSAIGISAGP